VKRRQQGCILAAIPAGSRLLVPLEPHKRAEARAGDEQAHDEKRAGAELHQAESKSAGGPPEVGPKPYTVTYAPAEGSQSRLDPPAFVWLPVEGAREYLLQYSRDSGFPPNATTTVTCSRFAGPARRAQPLSSMARASHNPV
jgi:hypothetical protein